MYVEKAQPDRLRDFRQRQEVCIRRAAGQCSQIGFQAQGMSRTIMQPSLFRIDFIINLFFGIVAIAIVIITFCKSHLLAQV